MPEWLAASHILVLSIIPQLIIPVCKVGFSQSFDESFGLLFSGTMDKTLMEYQRCNVANQTPFLVQGARLFLTNTVSGFARQVASPKREQGQIVNMYQLEIRRRSQVLDWKRQRQKGQVFSLPSQLPRTSHPDWENGLSLQMQSTDQLD